MGDVELINTGDGVFTGREAHTAHQIDATFRRNRCIDASLKPARWIQKWITSWLTLSWRSHHTSSATSIVRGSDVGLGWEDWEECKLFDLPTMNNSQRFIVPTCLWQTGNSLMAIFFVLLLCNEFTFRQKIFRWCIAPVQRSFEPGHINSKNHSLIDAMIKGVTGLWQNEVFRRVDSAKFFQA